MTGARDDLVVRLRYGCIGNGYDIDCSATNAVMSEAAAEIERLQALLAPAPVDAGEALQAAWNASPTLPPLDFTLDERDALVRAVTRSPLAPAPIEARAVAADIDEMIRLRNSRSPSINQLREWRDCVLSTRALQGSAGVGEALRDIAAERQRQIEVEGWSAEHDDGHGDGELAKAAGCYALHAGGRRDFVHAPWRLGSVTQPRGWPWCATWWKPKDPRRDLVRAGALIVAEIERIDRVALPPTQADRLDQGEEG